MKRILTEKINKIALQYGDDKRVILDDEVNIYSYGHYKLQYESK